MNFRKLLLAAHITGIVLMFLDIIGMIVIGTKIYDRIFSGLIIYTMTIYIIRTFFIKKEK